LRSEGKTNNDITSSTYPLKAYIEKTLTYDKNSTYTHLKMEGYEPDDNGYEDKISIDKTACNDGFTKRRSQTIGKPYYFNMIIHADFFTWKEIYYQILVL